MPPISRPLRKKVLFLFIATFAGFSVFCQENNPLVNSGELIKQGIEFHDKGKYKDAIALFRQVPRSDTNYSTALYELSVSSYSDNQFEESKQIAELGLKLFPERADEYYLVIANALDNMGKQQEALEIYNKQIERFPNKYNIYFNKGLVLRTLKKTEEAKAAFQKALLINPFHSSSHFFYGKTCLEEGDIISAMLAFQTCLLVAPSGNYSKNAVQYLSAISKVTDEISGYVKGKSAKLSPDFSLIQEIVLSKIALDKQYKLMVDLEDQIFRQMQVVLEKLEYNKNDRSFAMQFYVPFYTEMFRNKMFQPLLYQIFSGLGIEDIDKWNKKNKSVVDQFATTGSAYFIDIRNTQVADPELRKNVTLKYYYYNGKLTGKGSYINEEKQLPGGQWEFYFPNTGVQSKGSFDSQGKKTGEWTIFYEDGSIQETLNYKEGEQNGVSKGWFRNGNPWYNMQYVNGLSTGLQNIYYYNGIIKSETNFKAGKKDGVLKEYYNSGRLRGITNYKDDKKEGTSTYYYSNGKTETVWDYRNDIGEGPYKKYAENGTLIQEGNTINNMREGLWTTYYDNGKIKEKTTYIKNDITGNYFQYYENGQVSQSGKYNKGKVDGKIQAFDEDGKVYADYTYENGRLREVNFYDKEGKVISSTGTRKGAATITYYSPLGVKLSEGYFNKDGNKDGVFTYFYPSGSISQVENYKNSELNGMATGYYTNGGKKFEIPYANGVQEGYVKKYFSNGRLKYEGWVKEDLKQGIHINYDQLGNIISKENYLNDEPAKYSEYYHPGLKPDYENMYTTGWLDHTFQMDTTGKVIQENVFKKGNGPMIFKYDGGKNLIEASYKNYALAGAYKNYFFDGSLSAVSYFKHGEFDSAYKAWYFGGQLKIEGSYKDGGKSGKWKFYHENGKIFEEENYVNGNLDGEDKQYNVDGTLDKTLTYRNGELEGPYRIYGEANNLAVQLNYKEGEIMSYTYNDKTGKMVEAIPLVKGSGKIIAYYPNGNKSVEFDLADGEYNGVRKIYFTSGKLYVDGKRKNGEEYGTKKIYYPDGTLNNEENYYFGELHGVSKTYYPSGKIHIEQNYYNGDLHGVAKYYDEKGTVVTTMTYYYSLLLNSR